MRSTHEPESSTQKKWGGFDPDFRAGMRQANGPKKYGKQDCKTLPDARIVTKNPRRGKMPASREPIPACRLPGTLRPGGVAVGPAVCKCAIVSSLIFNLGLAGQIVHPLSETAPA
jgi:hypothetical protein